MSETTSSEIYSKVKESSTKFDSSNEVAIILAAGHGKRIKSQTSKMLHKIWRFLQLNVFTMHADLEFKISTQ